MANHRTALDDEFPFRMRASSGTFEAERPQRGKAVRISDAPFALESGGSCLGPTKTKTLSTHRIAMEKTVTACGHLTAYRYARTPHPPAQIPSAVVLS